MKLVFANDILVIVVVKVGPYASECLAIGTASIFPINIVVTRDIPATPFTTKPLNFISNDLSSQNLLVGIQAKLQPFAVVCPRFCNFRTA